MDSVLDELQELKASPNYSQLLKPNGDSKDISNLINELKSGQALKEYYEQMDYLDNQCRIL